MGREARCGGTARDAAVPGGPEAGGSGTARSGSAGGLLGTGGCSTWNVPAELLTHGGWRDEEPGQPEPPGSMHRSRACARSTAVSPVGWRRLARERVAREQGFETRTRMLGALERAPSRSGVFHVKRLARRERADPSGASPFPGGGPLVAERFHVEQRTSVRKNGRSVLTGAPDGEARLSGWGCSTWNVQVQRPELGTGVRCPVRSQEGRPVRPLPLGGVPRGTR